MCRFVAEYGPLILFLMLGDIIHISAINTTCSVDHNNSYLWVQEDYPNPQIDLGKCRRKSPGYVIPQILYLLNKRS